MDALRFSQLENNKKVNELLQALELLKKIGKIIRENSIAYDTAKDNGLLGYYEAIFEVESKYSDLTLELCDAIGCLISNELSKVILK